jgi:hypothetical protein
MKDFTIKLTQMNELFICKFSLSDYINHEFKIYYISPDGNHEYLSVNQIQDTNHQHECTIGSLYFDSKTKTMFEDTQRENFIINRKNYKDFIKYFNILKSWSNTYIDDIEKIYGKNLVM